MVGRGLIDMNSYFVTGSTVSKCPLGFSETTADHCLLLVTDRWNRSLASSACQDHHASAKLAVIDNWTSTICATNYINSQGYRTQR